MLPFHARRHEPWRTRCCIPRLSLSRRLWCGLSGSCDWILLLNDLRINPLLLLFLITSLEIYGNKSLAKSLHYSPLPPSTRGRLWVLFISDLCSSKMPTITILANEARHNPPMLRLPMDSLPWNAPLQVSAGALRFLRPKVRQRCNKKNSASWQNLH